MPQLVCDGRFYRGYNMKVIMIVIMIMIMIMMMLMLKLGDSGQISLRSTSSSGASSSALCLFKFYPASDCVIRLRLSSLSLSSLSP